MDAEIMILDRFGEWFIAQVRDRALMHMGKNISGRGGDKTFEVIRRLYIEEKAVETVERLIARAVDCTVDSLLEFFHQHAACFRYPDGTILDVKELTCVPITLRSYVWIEQFSRYPEDYPDSDVPFKLERKEGDVESLCGRADSREGTIQLSDGEKALLETFGEKLIFEVRDRTFTSMAKTLAGHLGDETSESLWHMYDGLDKKGAEARAR